LGALIADTGTNSAKGDMVTAVRRRRAADVRFVLMNFASYEVGGFY
jgi:hypothetical protein